MQRGFPFISFAIMVQNEEKVLKPLLEQLTDFSKQYHNSEIVIVDGGSNDATIELASKYVPMEKIFVRQFENDFSDQRNFLTSLCSGEWIFHIDADELMSRDLFFKLNDMLTQASSNNIDVLLLPRVNSIPNMTLEDKEKFENWGWIIDEERHINYPDYQSRIQRKNSMIKWVNPVHERLEGFQKYYHVPADDKKLVLLHKKDKIRQYQQQNRYRKITEDLK